MKMNLKKINRLAIVGLLVGVIPRLSAQNITGEIDGRVLDKSGALVRGAKVSLLNVQTRQVARVVTTGSKGEYSAPLLAVGTYLLSVEAPGFSKQTSSVATLGVGDTLTEDFSLAPEGTSTVVEVVTSSESPNLATAENSSTISTTQVQELALNTRNFQQMIALAPGVVYNGPDQLYPGMVTATGVASPSNFAINGLQYAQVTWLLDGSDILNHSGNGQVTSYPNVDAITEIKVIRNGYGAQYGGAGSAQVIIASKTGGAAFHGNLFYFFRNKALNANAFFNKLASPILPRPTLRYNDFGFTVGGPVFVPGIYPRSHSKTYFFFAQELRRIGSSPTQSFSNYPAAAQSAGYFAHPVCVAYTVVAGKQTCSSTSAAVANSPYTGFNYFVPKIEATAAAYLKDVILPAQSIQQVNSPTDVQGIILQERATNNETQELLRIDHQIGKRVSVFFRYLNDPIHLVIPNQYAGNSAGFPGVSNQELDTYGRNYMGHATVTATQSTIAEVGYSYQPYGIIAAPIGALLASKSPDIHVNLPYATTLGRIPNIAINGGQYIAKGPSSDTTSAQQAFINLTHVQGRHTTFVGGNFEHFDRTNNLGTTNAGTFTFTGTANKATGLTAFEQSFANFLIGAPSTFTQASVDPLSTTSATFKEAYVQDDWRATSRLALNFGVRYSIYGQPYDRNGHLGVFQPEFYDKAKAAVITPTGTICTSTANCAGKIPNSSYDPLNGIIQNNTANSYGGSISRTPKTNFAPRVGFAYDITGDGRASLRGGYGIFYNQTQLNFGMNEVNANPAYVQNPVFSSAPLSFANPSAGASVSNSVQSIYGQQRDWVSPYTQSFNLDLQASLPGKISLDIGYVGNTTQHLLGVQDLNQPLPGAYAAAGLNGGAFITSGASTASLNAIRPYLGYDSIFQFTTRSFADYNSLQTSLRKRFSGRSLVSVNYTWAKSLSNVATNFVGPQNIYDLKAEWGPSVQDRRNVMTANYVYDFPKLSQHNVFVRQTLGGWEISGIVTAVSGQWLTVVEGNVDPAGQGGLAPGSNAVLRPDMISNPNQGGARSLSQFFNTAAFVPVPVGQYRNGNEKRGSVEGPGYQNYNLAVFRNFSLPHETSFQFRFETFNTFNHTNYDTVNVNSVATAFGQVTGARDNRQVQIATKLNF